MVPVSVLYWELFPRIHLVRLGCYSPLELFPVQALLVVRLLQEAHDGRGGVELQGGRCTGKWGVGWRASVHERNARLWLQLAARLREKAAVEGRCERESLTHPALLKPLPKAVALGLAAKCAIARCH